MELPSLLRMNDGREARNAADWQLRRAELLETLRTHAYGYSPAPPEAVTGRAVGQTPVEGGTLTMLEVGFPTQKGHFAFPLRLFTPDTPGKHPLFLLIHFDTDPEHERFGYPLAEILSEGFALALIYYKDITSDDGDMTNGLAGQYDRRGDGTEWGKISMWAWGASRALDALLTRDDIDPAQVAVIGHSRLGKTALWCAAQDERIRYAISNDSGCAGMALERTRHEGGERLEDITRVFPYWFCGNYLTYVGHISEMPFDQHFLAGAIAPRYVIAGSASEDDWADPYSEQLCCTAITPAWQIHGLTGFAGPDTPAQVSDSFAGGEVGYHLRAGDHRLNRTDWLEYMAFIKAKMRG